MTSHLNTRQPDFEGISYKMLHHYVAMRQLIDNEAKTIHSLSSMLALLQECGDDRIEVDAIALGYVNEMISHHILNIGEYLDDFIYIVKAKQELEKIDN